jgi:hypothetical protein
MYSLVRTKKVEKSRRNRYFAAKNQIDKNRFKCLKKILRVELLTLLMQNQQATTLRFQMGSINQIDYYFATRATFSATKAGCSKYSASICC